MMRVKNIAIGEAQTETHFFAGKPRKNLAFEAKIGEEVWKFDLCLGEGEMDVDEVHRTFPWLSCFVTRGGHTIRAGEIPFDEETAKRFEWDPELDVPEFFSQFLKEWAEFSRNSGLEEELAIEFALQEAILQWGAKVAKNLED